MDELALLLRKAQANAFQMYSQTHGYHWNVVGPHFKQFHAFFLEIYEDVFESIDLYAEMQRKIGKYAPFGAANMALISDVQINDTLDLKPYDMLQELYKTNQAVLDCIVTLFDKANELNEQGICNDVATRISQHQFWAWQLKSSFEWGWG
jgi:starvation-inducible DNA-binding protein